MLCFKQAISPPHSLSELSSDWLPLTYRQFKEQVGGAGEDFHSHRGRKIPFEVECLFPQCPAGERG